MNYSYTRVFFWDIQFKVHFLSKFWTELQTSIWKITQVTILEEKLFVLIYLAKVSLLYFIIFCVFLQSSPGVCLPPASPLIPDNAEESYIMREEVRLKGTKDNGRPRSRSRPRGTPPQKTRVNAQRYIIIHWVVIASTVGSL